MNQVVCAAAAACFAMSASADAVDDAREVLKSWAPTSIEEQEGTLTVILPQRQITPDIYSASILAGLCLAPIFDLELEGVREVEILNEFGAQGYVRESGIEGYEELNELRVDDSNRTLYLMAQTHIY